MEDESFLAVQEPEAEHVPVDEVPERTCVQRQAIPDSLQPPRALVGRAKRTRGASIRIRRAHRLLARLLNGVAIVFGNPDGDVSLIAVVFDQIARKHRSRTRYMEVVIDQVILIEDDRVPAKQLEQVLRIVAAVTNPAATEDLPPIQVTTYGCTFCRPLRD